MQEQEAYIFRSVEETDWAAVLTLANLSAPWKAVDNPAWLANRQAFSSGRFPQRHYLAIGPEKNILAFGAVEGSEDGWYRLFLVMGPNLLLSTLADRLFDRLAEEARELGAQGLWARETSADANLIGYLKTRGFTEYRRIPGEGGTELIALRRQLPDVCYLP